MKEWISGMATLFFVTAIFPPIGVITVPLMVIGVIALVIGFIGAIFGGGSNDNKQDWE